MIFVDDILLVSKTFDEHVRNLRTIFHKFRQANMSLNLDKCELIKPSIQFLGHIISSSGIQPDPTKITSITNFPIPRNHKGLRAFLGLTGYYRRFTPLYAERTQPLLELTKKGRKW